MAGFVAKNAANLVLKKQMKAYKAKKVESGDDPYFAMIEDPRRPGKFKKVKKTIPTYIPEHDALILASVRKTAYRLDMCLFNFAGIRFGWEAVIGIIPAIGDVIGVLLAISVYKKCQKVEGGLDSSTSLQMLINIALDFAVGLIPFLGDIADAAFKCNTKNARLLEVYLDKKHRPRNQGRDERDHINVDKQRVKKNRQSGIYLRNDPPPATTFEDFSDEEGERQDFIRQGNVAHVQEPQPTVPQQTQRSGGWLDSIRGKKQNRAEMSQTTGTV
ncbi:hypothetical protein AMS68_000171 [Peltaster fructicola]|uniref:PH domain-containing protein n=1 Tax=Peltaster fructicola TaxID=286661 RepID=A0A6H0XIW6_9PEZI|nr:hypothetical protein AMS68_000171 [Peltaster fructicola]